MRNVPTCQTGFWRPSHRGCPVCGPNGPCNDIEYEQDIQADLTLRRFRKALAIVVAVVLAIALLAGCSTPTVTKVETIEVKVPVAVQPIRADQVPQPPAPLPKRPADARAALDVALAKVCEFVAYAVKADPLLRISAGGDPRALPVYPECEAR